MYVPKTPHEVERAVQFLWHHKTTTSKNERLGNLLVAHTYTHTNTIVLLEK